MTMTQPSAAEVDAAVAKLRLVVVYHPQSGGHGHIDEATWDVMARVKSPEALALLLDARERSMRLLEKFHIETECVDGAHWHECNMMQDVIEDIDVALVRWSVE